MSAHLASAVGYDPRHVEALPAAHRWALAVVGVCTAVPLVLVGLSAGYGVYVASDAPLLAVLFGALASAYLANLLRLTIAGGGVAPHQPPALVRAWAPRAVPLVMLVTLGVFFAQPLLLAALARRDDAAIETLRGQLRQLHEQGVVAPARALKEASHLKVAHAKARVSDAREKIRGFDGEPEQGASAQLKLDAKNRLVAAERGLEDALREAHEAEAFDEQVRTSDLAAYQQHLEHSHFMLKRLELAWRSIELATLLTGLMALLMVLPWLAMATFARKAHQAYELRRWAAARALIEVAYAQSRAEERAALSRWATFSTLRAELYSDAPFNTVARGSAQPPSVSHG